MHDKKTASELNSSTMPLKNIMADFAVDRNVANMTTIDVSSGASK